MKRTAGLILALLLLGGCAGSHNTGNSFVGNVPNETAQQIAIDAVAYMTSLYPPGHTTLELVAPKEQNNFSQGFENGLRAVGFTISKGIPDAVTVAYVLDGLQAKTSLYLQLIIVDPNKGRTTVTRAYTPGGVPEAGFSSRKAED
jgi:hypothetical protein